MGTLLPVITEFIKKSGLRKLSFAFYVEGIVAFLMFQQKISEAAFSEVSTWLMVGVFASNSFEHFVKSKGDKQSGSIKDPSDPVKA